MKAALLTSLSALALSACAVGPNYVAPIAPPSATAPFVTANTATVTTPADQNWWRMYRDPALDALVADALAANTDLRVAVARLDAAKASLRGARADRLPQVTAGASGTYGRLPQSQRLPGSNREAAVFDCGKRP